VTVRNKYEKKIITTVSSISNAFHELASHVSTKVSFWF